MENLSIPLFGKLDLIGECFARMRKEQIDSKYFIHALGLMLDAVNSSSPPDWLGLFTEERLQSEPNQPYS